MIRPHGVPRIAHTRRFAAVGIAYLAGALSVWDCEQLDREDVPGHRRGWRASPVSKGSLPYTLIDTDSLEVGECPTAPSVGAGEEGSRCRRTCQRPHHGLQR